MARSLFFRDVDDWSVMEKMQWILIIGILGAQSSSRQLIKFGVNLDSNNMVNVSALNSPSVLRNPRSSAVLLRSRSLAHESLIFILN